MLIIQSWSGRTGNNILQIIRAIHYAIINSHNSIQFQHPKGVYVIVVETDKGKKSYKIIN